jgi:hypothetical protein
MSSLLVHYALHQWHKSPTKKTSVFVRLVDQHVHARVSRTPYIGDVRDACVHMCWHLYNNRGLSVQLLLSV